MFKKILLITAVLFSACSTVEDVPLPFESTNEKATEFFNKAVYHIDQGEWREGRDNFQSALRVDPNFIMANMWGWSEDPVQTRKYRETALANKENANDAEKIMIEMLEAGRKGKASERLELAKKLVNKYSSSSEAHVILGNVYTGQDNLDKAIESYENALKVNPDNYNAWKQLARHHIVVGNNNMLPKDRQDKSKAVKYAEEMLRIRPKAPTLPITDGIVMITSTSVHPPLIFVMYSSKPTKSAPASLASASLSGLHKTKTRTSLPVP